MSHRRQVHQMALAKTGNKIRPLCHRASSSGSARRDYNYDISGNPVEVTCGHCKRLMDKNKAAPKENAKPEDSQPVQV